MARSSALSSPRQASSGKRSMAGHFWNRSTTRRNIGISPDGRSDFIIRQIFAMNFAFGAALDRWNHRALPQCQDCAMLVSSPSLSSPPPRSSIGSHGKDYYLAPAYPTMFAAGAVVCAGHKSMASAGVDRDRRSRCQFPSHRSSCRSSIRRSSQRISTKSHLRPRPDRARGHRRAAHPGILRSNWVGVQMEKQVATIYRSLPPEDQAPRTLSSR